MLQFIVMLVAWFGLVSGIFATESYNLYRPDGTYNGRVSAKPDGSYWQYNSKNEYTSRYVPNLSGGYNVYDNQNRLIGITRSNNITTPMAKSRPPISPNHPERNTSSWSNGYNSRPTNKKDTEYRYYTSKPNPNTSQPIDPVRPDDRNYSTPGKRHTVSGRFNSKLDNSLPRK